MYVLYMHVYYVYNAVWCEGTFIVAQVVKEWVESRLTEERNASQEGLQQLRTESDHKVHTVYSALL